MNMKRVLGAFSIAVCLLTMDFAMYAQTTDTDLVHQGFYLSMSVGPVWGPVNGEDNTGMEVKVEGTGFNFEFEIGGALKNEWILHGTLAGNSVFGPKFNDVKVSSDISFDEIFYGAGVTKYFKPSNMFVTLNAGMGKFSISDDSSSSGYTITTEGGFSYQIKFGKEWMVSDTWGLGAMAYYMSTRLTSNPEPGIEEKWDSSRFGISFQATLNRVR